MARRPTPPRPRPGASQARPPAAERRTSAQRETPAVRGSSSRQQGDDAPNRAAQRRTPAALERTPALRRPRSGAPSAAVPGRTGTTDRKGTAERTSAESPASTANRAGAGDAQEEAPGRGRVVQAADRFGGMLRARPWRRRRRAIVLGTAGTVIALIILLVVAITIPPLRVHEVSVTGAGYVDASAVTDAASPQKEHSMLLVRSGAVEKEVEKVPGVRSAEVSKKWPSTLSVEVTERTPLATLKDADGSTHILDGDGVELPEGAGKDKKLVPLTISGKGGDTDAISASMLSVLAALPDSMRSAVTGISASSTNDVTLTVKADSGTKKIVWGNAQDSELKAKVATTLLSQPGSEIDVTSPVAPVTR